jgi:hypothetical protein
LAIQIHGGYGYTRDFDVEQLYRDNRLNAIHEGTTGIQALDLLGRKIIKDRGRGLTQFEHRVTRTLTAAGSYPELARHAADLASSWNDIDAIAKQVCGLDDGAEALQNATPFLSASPGSGLNRRLSPAQRSLLQLGQNSTKESFVLADISMNASSRRSAYGWPSFAR